jgi:hypothetical protein
VTVLVDLGAGPVGHAVALVLAQNPEPPPDKGQEFGKASPVGLVVILLLGIATVFLIRSMTKRLRRLPASFDTPPPPEERGDIESAPPRAPARDVPPQADHVDREAPPDR